MKKIKVTNMISSKGNAVANQFECQVGDTRYFQSYDSVIAKIDSKGQVTLDKNYWDYSITTGKYRNQFLGEGIAETRMNIKNRVYKLADLN